MRHKVKQIMLTCEAFPAQWEGRIADGKYLYVRFRSGKLRATIADTMDSAVQGNNAQTFILTHGREHAGEMSLAEMIALTRDFLDFSNCEFLPEQITFYQYMMSPEQISLANPSFNLNTGELMPIITPEDEPTEITADKERYIVDPQRKKIDV